MAPLQSLAEDEALEQPLPSMHEISSMQLREVVASIAAAADDPDGATAAAACCFRLAVLVQRISDEDESVAATALTATLDAMQAHEHVAAVQSAGSEVVAFMCVGARDADAEEHLKARLAHTLQAGGVATVASGMTACAAASNFVPVALAGLLDRTTQSTPRQTDGP